MICNIIRAVTLNLSMFGWLSDFLGFTFKDIIVLVYNKILVVMKNKRANAAAQPCFFKLATVAAQPCFYKRATVAAEPCFYKRTTGAAEPFFYEIMQKRMKIGHKIKIETFG